MYLKDLTVRGFKSFAQTTRFHFEPGITAVVGPNGSGKSNVVDALAWVMGEQGAKSLRGGNMADVIFAGSSARPALGRAQVELTIDNSDGRLPIDYSEVTISRTMFRSGGSEYAINKQPVRLLDVQELLSDSGLGRQMHVIVGQGQLDAVLTATAQERRAFIDEAAGIAKHRRRKERALKKLESMDSNLVRVLDLTQELRRTLRPLAKQAKAAREAAGVQERVDYARSRLLAADLVEAQQRCDVELASLEALRARNQACQEQMNAAQSKMEAADTNAQALAARAQALQEHYRDFRELATRLGSIAELATERAASAKRVPSAITDQSVQLAAERAREAQDESERAVFAAAEAGEAATKSQAERALVQGKVDAAKAELVRQQKRLTAAQNAHREAERRIERARASVRAATEQLERADKAQAAAAERLEALAPVPQEKDGQAGESEQMALKHRLAAQAQAKAREDLDAAQRQERSAAEALSRELSRRETLAASLREDGADSKDERWNNALNAAQSLSSQVTVRSPWEDAVTALLGHLASARVLADASELSGLLGVAPSAGGALLAPAPPGRETIETQRIEGGVPAASVITGDPQLVQTLSLALSGCYLCEDESAAVALTAGTTLRAATADAKVFTSEALVLPGATGPSSLRLRTQLESATKDAERAKEELETVAARTRAARQVLSDATLNAESALEELRRSDAQAAADAAARARASALRVAAEADLSRAQDARAKAVLAQEAAQQAAEALEESDTPAPSAEAFLKAPQETLTSLESKLDAAREATSAAMMAARVAQERRDATARQALAFKTQAERLREDRERQLERETRALAVNKGAQDLIRRAREGEHKANQGRARLESARDEVQSAQAMVRAHSEAAKAELAALESARAKTHEQLLQAEVAFAQFQSARENVLSQVVDVLGLEPRAATETSLDEQAQGFIKEFGPQVPWGDQPFDRAVASAELAKAERELQRLGVVNPLAVEEHAALESRLNFLLEQVDDLNRSKADLLELVREIDAQVKSAFTAAFDDVSNQFNRVFAKLFPGGKGRLELTDPEDPLATGVEIYARPAGKKVTRLSLLSGGERSLAALAYLIAIFLARPSPFYVMDEVEAALDDVNLSRVLSLFEDLRHESQLLVVTHQKRTMEIADALYGVSMKDGVTAVVSHRMD